MRGLTERQQWRLGRLEPEDPDAPDTIKVVKWWGDSPIVRWSNWKHSMVRPNGKLTGVREVQLRAIFDDDYLARVDAAADGQNVVEALDDE